MKTALPLLALLALSGCSWERSARIEAGVSQPQFTFTNLGRFIGSNPEPVCATRITLLQDDAPVWQLRAGSGSQDEKPGCVMIESVRYGEVPAGFYQSIAPQPLQQATVYQLRFDNIGEYPRGGSRAFCLDAGWEVTDVRWENGSPHNCRD